MIYEDDSLNENERLRKENEIKKLKLSAEFGARFYENQNTDLPPDIASQFLNNIQKYEEAAAKQKSKKIKEILGNPAFKPKESLNDAALKEELTKIIEFMSLHHINLDVIHEVEEREIYRFITEELIEEELNVFGIPGMTSCFIYEEFYPNHEEDIKRYSLEFLNSLLKKNFEFMHFNISQKMQYNDETINAEQFVEKAKYLMEKAGDIILPSSEIISVDFHNELAEVNCVVSFKKLNPNKDSTKCTLNARLFYYNDYGYWYMDRAVLPELGFN